jgi:hypothetical protein
MSDRHGVSELRTLMSAERHKTPRLATISTAKLLA